MASYRFLLGPAYGVDAEPEMIKWQFLAVSTYLYASACESNTDYYTTGNYKIQSVFLFLWNVNKMGGMSFGWMGQE
ncbi:MAG: hypothetical protein HFH40_04690 [Lachnospiraceae bacterium]|jgi:hypothetical protein|nr:hypothetical protein [Lachnospiraceae bacterium]